MSNHLISATYKRSLGTGTRKAIMVLMADKASDDGRGIYASKQTMADELDLSKQAVIRTISGLIADGLLIEVGQRPCDTGYTVEYAINVAALISLPAVGYEKKRTERAEARKQASPVTQGDRSPEVTPTGHPALPKPLSKPFSPQPPELAQPKEADEGDQFWKVPAGKSWADVGPMLRKLEGKPERKPRRSQAQPAPVVQPLSYIRKLAVQAKKHETDRSAVMHAVLRREVGSALYQQWFEQAALIPGDASATVIVASAFQQSWMEERFRPILLSAARSAFGEAVRDVRFEVEQRG